MSNQAELSQAIATVERQISEAKSEVAKKSLNAKLERLKEELKSGAKKGTSTLATLSNARKSVRKLASKDFKALIEKLSKKPEYAFLKGYSEGKLKDDLARVAKPMGYRFYGENTKKPTIPQIKKGLKDGTVYYEKRPRHSDVSRVVQLGEGGSVSTETIDLKFYNIRGQVVESGKVIIDYDNETITLASGKTYKVEPDREYTYRFLKTKIRAVNGIKGLSEFLKEINAPKKALNTVVRAFIDSDESKMATGGSVGKFEYKTVNTSTESGLKAAEKLKADGWKVISTGLETIQFERAKEKKMEDGGRVDLFEDYENIPPKIQEILDKYSDAFGGDGSDMDYKDTANMLKEFEAEGYTFDYGLDNEPFGLRPIGVKLNELRDYEDFDDDKMATGGNIASFNWKNFTLKELSEALPTDVEIVSYDTPTEKDQRPYNPKNKKFYTTKKLTIGIGEAEISRGDENIYLEITCYDADNKSSEEYEVKIYSKENHKGLKEVANAVIEKMKHGGTTKPHEIGFYVYETKRIFISWKGIRQPFGNFFSAKEALEMINKVAQTKKEKLEYKIVTPDGTLDVADFIDDDKMATGGTIDNSFLGKTSIGKGFHGWTAETSTTKQIKGYDWEITTMKRYGGELVSTATGGKSMKQDGYSTFEYSPFEDPNYSLVRSKPKMVNEKAVTKQHEEALKIFIEKMNEMSGEIMATGGGIEAPKYFKNGGQTYTWLNVTKMKSLIRFNNKKEAQEAKKILNNLNDEFTYHLVEEGDKFVIYRDFSKDEFLLNIINSIGTDAEWVNVSSMKKEGSFESETEARKKFESLSENGSKTYYLLTDGRKNTFYVYSDSNKSDKLVKEIMATGGTLEDNLLPPSKTYGENIAKAMEKFDISSNEARKKYGQYTIKQWSELLGEKMENGGEVGDISKSEIPRMQKITKLKGLYGYMPSINVVYYDSKTDKFYFQDFEGDYMEVRNISTLEQLDKFLKENNITLDKKMATGGSIPDNYEGRTPEDIWNSLSKRQRQHFLYDHLSEIEVYKNTGELPSSEIIKAYNSEWSTLDRDIKNRFTNHTREGQYATGGSVGGKKYSYLPNEDISKIVLKSKQVIGKDRILDGAYIKSKGKTKSSEKFSFPVGSVVWDKTHKRYGVVLNNFGNEFEGEGGEIRLDSDGVQPIFEYDKKFNRTEKYNLVPYGSKDDKGDGDLLDIKESGQRLIDSRKERGDEEYVKYYQDAFGDVIAGKIDGKPYVIGTSSNHGKFGDDNPRLVNFDIDDLDQYEEMVYNDMKKSNTKAATLQVIINTVEGDYTQLSPELAEIAEEQFTSDEWDEESNKRYFATGGGVDGLKRFDVDFYDSSDAKRDTSIEISIRQNSLENTIEMAIKKAYDFQKNYIEFYYKNLFLGSINFATSEEFRKGKDYDKFMSDDKYAKGGGVSPYYGGMSEAEILKATVVYDNGGETLDRYTVFTPDSSVFGMSATGDGFNQYIGDDTEIEKGSHLGKRLKTVPKDIKSAVLNRMKEEFADGGSMYKKGGNTGYAYVPNADIEKIVGKDGKEYGQKVLLDGAYVKDKVRTPKMSRTQFEDDVYAYGSGGNLGKSLYVAYSSYFDYNSYDTNLITDTLKATGAKNIRLERERPNSPEVVVFNGDKQKAKEALNSAFDTETILIYEKDWRTSKYGQGGEVKELIEEIRFVEKDNISNWGSQTAKDEYIKELYKEIDIIKGKTKLNVSKGDTIKTLNDRIFYVENPNYSEDYMWVKNNKNEKFGYSLPKADVVDVVSSHNKKFDNGGAIEVRKMKKEKEKMVSELFEKCGVFFAFSDKQFEENKTPLKEGEKYVSIGGGGYLPKGKVKELEEGMEAIERFGKQTVKKKNLVEAEILDELQNHECFYTGDISDVVDLFEGTYTKQQIRDVYNKHREANQEYALGGSISDDVNPEDISFLQQKGYYFDGEFYFEADGEFIEVIQGSSPDERYKVAVLFRTNEIITISREMLDKISTSFGKNYKIELFTNAGVDLRSSAKGKYKNISVHRLPQSKMATGGEITAEEREQALKNSPKLNF